MPNTSFEEKYNRLKALLVEFFKNRDSNDYIKILDDLVAEYVVSEEYTCLSPEGKRSMIAMYRELRKFLLKLIEIRDSVILQTEEAA